MRAGDDPVYDALKLIADREICGCGGHYYSPSQAGCGAERIAAKKIIARAFIDLRCVARYSIVGTDMPTLPAATRRNPAESR